MISLFVFNVIFLQYMCVDIYIYTHIYIYIYVLEFHHELYKNVRLVGQLNHDSCSTTEDLRALKCIQFNSIQFNSIKFISIQQFAYISSQVRLRSLVIILYLC